MNLNKKALIFNIILFALELLGFILSIYFEKGMILKFYTNLSNYLGLIASSLFIINYLLKEKYDKFSKVVKFMKLTATIALNVTFFVVVFILLPMVKFDVYMLMIDRHFIIYHTLAPIIAIITFVCFEKYDYSYKKGFILGSIFSILYSIFISILILLKVVTPPYPFLDYYNNALWLSILSVIIVLSLIAFTIWLLLFTNIRVNKKA
ncbi:MAG: hypothetical protein J6Y28_08930 [Acholeplasmatales bacterium]|nr:hypothetical protein [Acholeplasmatales bacterium]